MVKVIIKWDIVLLRLDFCRTLAFFPFPFFFFQELKKYTAANENREIDENSSKLRLLKN